MRLFIAVDLEEAVKDSLVDVQQQAKWFAAKGSFSKRDHFHLTLRFIGETSEENLPLIHRAAEEAVQGAVPFQLTLNQLGHFQKKKQHVLWVGVEENSLLTDLQANVEVQLENWIQLPRENRTYTPHITLGRNIRFKEDWETLQKAVSVPTMSVDVSKVTLFHSTQVNGRLRYIPLKHFEFTH